MANYSINRGVGRSVEFRGLKAQYLYLFGGGLLWLFLLFTFLQMVGVADIIVFPFVTITGVALVWSLFTLNAKYGEHGVMKLLARKSHPRYIINRKTITKIVKCNRF